MTQGDFETFYPFQAGIGKGAPNNFESGYGSYSLESSYDDLDDSQDNQDSTDYEGEAQEVGDVQGGSKLGCFIKKVVAKKKELKAQYGKGYFSIGECGPPKIRLAYNPVARIQEVKVCVGWGSPSCDKKILGVCVGPAPCVNWHTPIPGNTQAYDAATARFEADKREWELCRERNKGIWKPGWRRKWREFKKSGGLKALRQQCVIELAGGIPAPAPVNQPKPTTLTPPSSTPQPSNTDNSTKRELDSGSDLYKYLVPIIIVGVLLIGGIYIYKTLKK